MAAQFHAAGFLVDFVGPADAIITVDNIKCFEESKRIQSEKAVQERVRQASSQINKRLSQQASAKPRGLIAIDISKTVNTDGKLYFSAPSADYLARWVDDQIVAFLSRNRTRLTSHLDPRVCAVLLYLRTPAVIEDEERLANFRRLFTVRTPENSQLNQRVYANCWISYGTSLQNRFSNERSSKSARSFQANHAFNNSSLASSHAL